MKKLFYVFIGFFITMFVLMGPMMSFAQREQGHPGRDLNQQQPDPGMGSQQPPSEMESEEGRGGTEPIPLIPTKGKVSGEVLNVDPSTGLIEIRTEEGLVNTFTVEGEAKEQLSQIEEGDRVDLEVTLNVVELIPQEEGRSTPPAG
jgi:translation initiation factor IF-1